MLAAAGLVATGATATPEQFAQSLCVALDVVYGSSGAYRYDQWVCKPGSMTANGTRQYRVWVRERHCGQTRIWYVVILPDATILDAQPVRYVGDTGGLLS
jgi:hypothetical protein